MRLITTDGKRYVDIGNSDIWTALYSTIVGNIKGLKRNGIADAIKFLETGNCMAQDGYKIARQFNLIRDGLASVSPSKFIYDINDKKKTCPWGRFSPIVTSCANLFTTADGGDLLFEIVSILTYAEIAKVDVVFDS